MNNSEFLLRFESCTLSPELFTHRAHLKLAWLHINSNGLKQAIEHCCTQILRFASFQGDDQKFNKTITIAAVYAVNHFIKEEKSFDEFIANNPQLLSDLNPLINSHYSFDVFDVPKARKTFIEPNLQAFV